MTERHFIFDIDGVLCDAGQPINKEFEWFLTDYLKDKKYYLVSGSPRYKAVNQIGMHQVSHSTIGFFSCGNSIWIDDEERGNINNVFLYQEEMFWLKEFYNTSKFPHKRKFVDEQIEHRGGSINFSTLWRNATPEDRQLYKNYDEKFKERIKCVTQFRERFPRLDIYLGGDVSVDIMLKGANKSQIIEYIYSKDREIHFFCDRYKDYEIDQPLVVVMEQYDNCIVHRIDNGYMQTKQILEELK